MRRTLTGIVASLLVVFLAGSAVIHGLSGKVSRLNTEVADLSDLHRRLIADNEALIAERGALQGAVEERTQSLAALRNELEDIEILIGLRAEPEVALPQRIDTASQTAFERRLMLESIPSGYPIDAPRVTSAFGMRRHPIEERMAMHGGIDFGAPVGTPIHATADGVVEWASKHHNSGLGNMVKLVHNYGFSTVYGHMHRIEAQVGKYVRRGDLIGYSGNSGASTAPHLHYEVRHLNRRLDPDSFLRWSMEDYEVLFTNEERVEWESLVEVIRQTASVPERQSLRLGQSWSATLP